MNAILKGKRKIPIPLSLKLEKELGMEEGILSVLQTYFEIEKAKEKHFEKPNFNIITKGLFWDTEIDKIDWAKHSDSVIRRTFERGNEEERKEILRFYGSEKVENCLSEIKRNAMKLHKNIPADYISDILETESIRRQILPILCPCK